MSAIVQSNQTIDLSFLQSLIDSGVPEGRTVDYKSQLIVETRDQKVEFCADVSAFANTTGGNLYIGIEEQAGLPTACTGMEVADVDDFKLKLEQILLNGIQPRLLGVEIESVQVDEDKYAFVIIIPRSWAQPHRVTLSGHSKFYARNSAGKYDMDVNDLRNAFLSTNTVSEKLREFRRNRINTILSNDAPAELVAGAKLALHIFPLNSLENHNAINLKEVESLDISPIGGSRHNRRYNIDGYFVEGFKQEGKAQGYVQCFRNGTIEAVSWAWAREYNGALLIASQRFEESIINTFQKYINYQNRLGLTPPFSVMLSLLDVKGCRMAVSAGYFDYPEPIDRDIVLIPELILDTLDFEADLFLKPMLDAVWNASGWPESIYYKENGRWQSK